MSRMRGILAGVVGVTAGCGACMAQDTSPPADGTIEAAVSGPAKLTLRVDAMAWYMGPGGDLDMPSTEALGDPGITTIDLLGYDSPRFVAAPEVNIGWGDHWRVAARGYYFADDHLAIAGTDGQIGSVLFDAGTELTSSFIFGCYEAEVGYRIYDFPPEVRGLTTRDFYGTIEVIGGLRMLELDWSVGRTAAGSFPGDQEVGIDEVFVQVSVGGRIKLDFGNDMGMDAQVSISGLPLGEGANTGFDVLVGGWWYPWHNVGVQLGYRAAFFDLGRSDGASSAADFEFRGWNQGLQFGVVVQF